MRSVPVNRLRFWIPPSLVIVVLGVTAVVLRTHSAGEESAPSGRRQAAAPATDRAYREWDVSQPAPEPMTAPAPSPAPRTEAPADDESELLLALSAGPAAVAETPRDAGGPAPTTLASNLSAGERTDLLRGEIERERAPARQPAPRFPIAIVEDTCDPPRRTLP